MPFRCAIAKIQLGIGIVGEGRPHRPPKNNRCIRNGVGVDRICATIGADCIYRFKRRIRDKPLLVEPSFDSRTHRHRLALAEIVAVVACVHRDRLCNKATRLYIARKPIMPKFAATSTELDVACGGRFADAADSENGLPYELEILVERCMGDAALAARLLKRFDERLPNVLGDIERLLHEFEWTAARERLHSLKGEAASLAASQLQSLAACMEARLKADGEIPELEIPDLVDALTIAGNRCRKALPEALQRLSSQIAQIN